MIANYFIDCDCELFLPIVIANYFIDCDCDCELFLPIVICQLFSVIVIVNCIINFVSKVKGMTISSKLLLENEVYGV